METDRPSPEIRGLLQDFYRLTGIKICVYDSEERELYYYPEKLTPFCAELRKNALLNEKCAACDRAAFRECRKTRAPSIRLCHAGLLECFAPILFDDGIAGYIAIGQIRGEAGADAPTLPDDLSPEDRAALAARFAALPVAEREKIDAAVRILTVCAGYEYLRSLADKGENGIGNRLAAYIEAHLAEDLSVETLEAKFRLSRRRIYEIFRERYDTSVASYVKERRLRRARELLRATREPVSVVAARCGFADYNYFSKQFRKSVGISPTAYRRGE